MMPPHPHPHPDAIADCVLNAFHALPQKYKPRRLADGRREWVPLAGVVVCRHPQKRFPETDHADPSAALKCVSLATGMKCLPQEKVKSARGNVLHDSHAEVLAIRGFNRWLVDECAELAKRGFSTGREAEWVRWRARGEEELGPDGSDGDGSREEKRGSLEVENRFPQPPFELQDGVQLHMYCSEAPCGDASMELVMREQADSTPWSQTPATEEAGIEDAETGMLGRGHFDQLGIVRRKPARPDAPVTLSKSCSDKLALKQCTGLLSALTTCLVGTRGTWLSTLTLPEDRVVDEAVERCFGPTGRMKGVLEEEVQGRWSKPGFGFRPFQVIKTSRVFEYARESSPTSEAGSPATVPSNLATVITPEKQEILINGVLQGRKQDDPRGASCLSRRRIWEGVRDVLDALGGMDVDAMEGEQAMTYGELKTGFRESNRKGGLLKAREMVKRDVKALALTGWKRNAGDEGWRLE